MIPATPSLSMLVIQVRQGDAPNQQHPPASLSLPAGFRIINTVMQKAPNTMKTLTVSFVAPLLCLLAAALPSRAADPPSSPEQQVLERFIGKWRTEYTHRKAEWTPVAKEGASDLTFNRVLDGQFVQERGIHDDKKTQLSMYFMNTSQGAGTRMIRIGP